MYQCAKCSRITTARSSAHYVVADIRPREYSHRANAIPVAGGKRRKRAMRDDRGGRGWEIKSEIMVCTDCLPGAEAEFKAKVEALAAPAVITAAEI